MFVIKDIDTKYYFHKDGKIILFERPEEAQHFLQAFQQYSVARYVQEQQSPFAILDAQQRLTRLSIIEQDFLETPECGIINYHDLGI